MFRYVCIMFFITACTTKVYALNSINHDAYIAGDATSFWTTFSVPVCWENPESYSNDQLENVKKAIDDTWGEYSALVFTGWDKCTTTSEGIRIVADPYAHPHVRTFGRFLNGVENGVVLNFDYLGEFKCPREKSECDRIIAVHEFGHAIGFHHEQNRTDTIENNIPCYDQHYQGKIPNENKITKWDLNSVMNYCNPNWAGDGYLSELDIEGLGYVYGDGSGLDGAWDGTWIAQTFNERINEKFNYEMQLTQKNNVVKGTYRTLDGNGVSGTIFGNISNGALEGTWQRTDSGAPANASGGFVFVGKPDSEFSGHYSQGAWSGYKVNRGGAVDISGNWQTEAFNTKQNRRNSYEIQFTQSGNEVKGRYSNSEIRGEISGELSGNVLRGKWKNSGNGANGDITFRFNSDNSFDGTYSQGTWIGSR